MFTREQLSDIQVIIQETITKLMKDEIFLNTLVTTIQEKLQINKMQQKIEELTKEVEKLKEEKQETNKIITKEIEIMKQHRKRKAIRMHGVTESNGEKVIEKALEILNTNLNLNLVPDNLENCFRVGKIRNEKRAILITFTNENTKKTVIQNRGKLKGTGISIAEDVTPQRYKLFREAKEKLGKENVWIAGGEIRAQIGQQRRVIKDKEELDQL